MNFSFRFGFKIGTNISTKINLFKIAIVFLFSRMKWKKDNKLQSLNDISKNEDKVSSLNIKREKQEASSSSTTNNRMINNEHRQSSSSSSSTPNSFN
jgi:hypothetical protein